MSERSGGPAGLRGFLRLALPALPVLAAEPVYLLLDTAVVGRLGAASLAALALGSVVFAQVSTQLTFLSYGTTARSARMFGARRFGGAVGEGVQATWLALGIGMLVVAAVQLLAHPVLGMLAGSGAVADAAVEWLRIAVCGAPLILITMAGNGWMRGVQDTMRPLRSVLVGVGVSAAACPVLVHGLLGAPRLGLPGSAVANVAGQVVTAALFAVALLRESRAYGCAIRPDWRVMRAQMAMGRDLILRSLAFQACFLSAVAVAGRFGAASLGAHQVVLQLWNFVALVLDALAIAAQALVGEALGAGRASGARALGRRVTRWSLWCSLVVSAVFAVGVGVVPRIFTSDAAVLGAIGGIWWIFVLLIPVAGIVFALDGVLLGSGDAAYLRSATLTCGLFGFLPMIWLSAALDLGLTGIWWGMAVFMVMRMIAVTARAASGRWAVPGAEVDRESNTVTPAVGR